MSTGFVLNIPDTMLEKLKETDKHISSLATKSKNTEAQVISAFRHMADNGVGYFLQQMRKANELIDKVGTKGKNMNVGAGMFADIAVQAKNAIDEVNRVVTAISKVKRASGDTGMAKNPFAGMSESLKQWNNLQSQIDATDAKIKKLTSTTMDYERQMQRMRSGQTTPMNVSYNEYAYTKERIAALQEEKRVLREKQEEITRQNNALSEQVRIQESLKRFVANQDSLPNRRSRDDYENLRRQLAEEEKASEKAEQKRVKDVEKAEKEAAKIREAERKKREKEEKATADRIAAYDSKARRERYKAYTTTYEGAMRTSDRAKTLLQEQQAIKNLEAARAKLNKTDSDYANKLRNLNQRILEHKKNIDKATEGSKNLQTQHRSLMDISGQLARKLALVFSVSQITGYVKKLIEVRGEFELQQRSLQAILQNKDEANRIWQQTVDLAVRSPFRVKELVSYTKQLAAYRIESDKLFETNKMLADISAGLGVDMQRLILAFGQVRSAAYLRGTELRQFTEAGIPILEQLAQYFTELEGRAVSVGDVFERVSKRMVSFADVEEIFKRMTSEGGTFYRMQEIQAETLQGQISNLKDSVDIMLNDIGKANETTLKNSVAMVRNFVENWEEVAAVVGHTLKILSPFIATMALAKLGSSALGKTVSSVAVGLWNFAGSIQKVGVGITGLSIKTAVATKAVQTLKTALIGLGSGVATVALSAFVYWCLEMWRKSTEAERAVKKLDKALEDIYTQDTSTLKTQIRGFENLIGRLKEANVNTRERKEIISQINSQYGEYLGFIVDEKTSYEQLANSIDSVTLALTRRAKATSFEKALAEVYGKTNEAIAESEKVLRNTMDDIFGTQVDGKALSLLPSEEEIIKIFDLIDKKTIELGRPLESSEIREVLEGFYGYFVSFNTTKKEAADFMSAIERRGQAVLTQREKELEIDRRINEVYKDNAESAAEATKAFKELEERRTAALSDAKGAPKWQVEKIKRDFEIEKIDLQVKYEGLDKATADLRKNTLESMNATVNDINKKIEGSISKLGEKYANLIYIDETEAATGVNQIAESTAAAYKAQKEILKQQNSLKKAGTAYDADILKNAQKSADAYYYKLQLLGRLDLLQKETTKEETKEMKLLRQQLAALKEAGQTYQSLRQDFDKETATQKTASAFRDLFAELKMTDLTKGMSFDELGILKVLEELPNKAGDEGKKAIEKLIAEFLGNTDVEKVREQTQELLDSVQEEFDRYNLTLELKKLNLPPDIAESLFDIEYLDLKGLKENVINEFSGTSEALKTELQKGFGNIDWLTVKNLSSGELMEAIKKALKDIDDLEEKQQLESAKRFVKFMEKNLDKTKIILEQRGIDIAFAKSLFDKGEIDAKTFAEQVKNIVAQSNEEISKFNLDKFKETPEYIQAMGDLASYSKKEIQALIKTLNDAVTQNAHLFDADEVKAYMDALKKAQEELESRDVFKWGDFGRAADIIQTQKEIEDKKADIETNKAELETQKQKLAELQAKLDSLKAQQKATQEAGGDTTQVDTDIEQTTSDIVTANEEIGKTNNEIKTNTGLLSLLGDKMKGLAGNMGTTLAIIDAIVHGINDTVQGINTIYGEIGSVMESFGKETDFSTGFGKGAMLMDTFAKSSQAAADGWDAFKNGDPVGVVVNVVKSITEIIKGINAYQDAGLEVIIQDHLEEVERLQKEYEKLEWAIDRAFSFKKYGMVAEQQENLAKQIENTQKAIAAEEDKKDTDKERIEELQGEIEEASKQIQELYDNLRADIVGTFEDLSSTLGDAMISALQQGEDALKAWSDSVNDIITDIVGQLLIQKYLEPQIANLVNDYYSQIMPKNARAENKYQEYLKAIERGDTATAEKLIEEYKKLAEQAIGEMPQINEDATKQFQSDLLAAGENFRDLIPDWLINSTKEGGGLSALQKGIQGITSDQAEILSAYWNSVRGYTASIDSKMDLILANMGVGVENNPMLDQLVSQTNILTKIHGILEDVASNSQRTFKTSLL